MYSVERVKRRFVHWLAHRLPACDEIARLSSEGMDRRLTLRERAAMRLHFSICVWCHRYQHQLLFLREAFHHHAAHDAAEAVPPKEGLSPEARERMRRTLSGTE